MNKQDFIEKTARRTPNLLESRQIHEEAVKDYYRKHPEAEKADRMKALLEFGIPLALGSANSLRSNQSLARSTAAGIPAAALVNILGGMGRAQKYNREEGVESNFLGTKVEPITEEARQRYFTHE